MLLALAQLRCAMEIAPVPPGMESGVGAGVPLVFEYRDALTGTALGGREVAQLPPTVRVSGAVLPSVTALEEFPDLALVRGGYALPTRGGFSVRVDGSVRYYGCAAELDAEGAGARRVVISLVPRARDVSVRVAIHRGEDTTARLSAEGIAAVEVRPDAPVEREAEVHAGRCSGEPSPAGESRWCVRFLGPEPTPIDLAVRAPGYGIARVGLDPTSAERTEVLEARYDGHVAPTAALRMGAGVGVVGGGSASYLAALDVVAPSRLYGTTCPAGQACVRPVAHLGVGLLPYARDTVLQGPGSQVTPDGNTSGTLMALEVGGGVMVIPPGTGDRFRATLLVSGAVAGRGDERDAAHANRLLSPASAVLGGAAEIVLGVRLFDGFVLQGGARATYIPVIGSRGRQFSFLGDAQASTDTTSLLHIALVIGLGVEL